MGGPGGVKIEAPKALRGRGCPLLTGRGVSPQNFFFASKSHVCDAL